MGGLDKGLQEFRGKSLVAWTRERILPQVDELFINANRNLAAYGALGHRVITDSSPDHLGPLAGLRSALADAAHERIVAVPCDSPHLPLDLAIRLRRGAELQTADVAVAVTGTQVHPVFLYCRRDILDKLDAYLAAGGRKMETWLASLRLAKVHFDDQPEAFVNLNSLEDLRRAES
jgi:molybdopterin-guanine dinucleotide biosynthesis protein A